VDNCEHLIGGCAKTAEAIMRSCPRVHLLATSREPLGIGGETLYRVPSLSLPGPEDSGFAPGSSDAVALFVERARGAVHKAGRRAVITSSGRRWLHNGPRLRSSGQSAGLYFYTSPTCVENSLFCRESRFDTRSQ
jgi:hypothetical protein